MRSKSQIFLLFLLISTNSYAIFYELSGNFGYDRTIYGGERQNKFTSRTWGGSVALYLTGYTGLEFNYSESEDSIIENESGSIDSTYEIIGTNNRVGREVFGVGLRQQLAPRKAFIVPMIAVGYAKQFTSSETDYSIRNKSTGDITVVTTTASKSRTDSVFGTFTLKFRLTKTFTINGSVKTVFKAFETEQAKDNLKYLAGFSWIF